MKEILIIIGLIVTNVVTSLPSGNSVAFGNHIEKPNSDKDDVNLNINSLKIFGKDITIEEAKYMAVVSCNVFGAIQPLGSGVILNNKWVLTAAFIVDPSFRSGVRVRIGTSNIDVGGELIEAEKVFTHPKYKVGVSSYNLALIKLPKSIKYSSKVQAASLSPKLPKNGQKVTVSGYLYRFKDKLQQNVVEFMDYKTCKHQIFEKEFVQSNFCSTEKGSSYCAGDLGSPLIFNKKLIGIFEKCSGHTTSVYADVTKFKGWISDTIKKNSSPGEELGFIE